MKKLILAIVALFTIAIPSNANPFLLGRSSVVIQRNVIVRAPVFDVQRSVVLRSNFGYGGFNQFRSFNNFGYGASFAPSYGYAANFGLNYGYAQAAQFPVYQQPIYQAPIYQQAPCQQQAVVQQAPVYQQVPCPLAQAAPQYAPAQAQQTVTTVTTTTTTNLLR